MDRRFCKTFETWFAVCMHNEVYWAKVISAIDLIPPNERGRFSLVIREIEVRCESHNNALSQPLTRVFANLLSITGKLVEKNALQQQVVTASFDWLRELFILVYAFAYGGFGIAVEDIHFLLAPLKLCRDSMTREESSLFDNFLKKLESS